MRPSRLLIGLVCVAAAGMTACSGASPASTDGDESEIRDGAEAQSWTRAYEMSSDSMGTFYFRLTRTGASVVGRALMPRSASSPAVPAMDVEGTVEPDGTYRLVWRMLLKGALDVPLVLREEQGALVGTVGDASDRMPAKLAPITATHDAPLVSVFRVSNEEDRSRTCQLDIMSVELFGMRDPAREASLNAAFAKSTADASAACTGQATAVHGGVGVAVVNDALSTYSASYMVDLPGDETKLVGEERINLLTSGGRVALWGDVLAPGSDATLIALIEESIDRTIGRGLIEVIGVERKNQLKVQMAERLAAGELAQDFLVGTRGVSFGTKGFDLRVQSITVTYEALRAQGILAQGGKARSAWESAPQ